MSNKNHGVNQLVEFLKNAPRAKLSDFPDYAQPYLSGYFPTEVKMIAPEPEAVIAVAINDSKRKGDIKGDTKFDIPTKEERDQDWALCQSPEHRKYTTAINRLPIYIGALEHIEKERDTLRDQLGALWTMISNIREPIKKCFIDRTMPFAEFHDIASRWSESVTSEGHPDYLAKRLKEAVALLKERPIKI